MRRLCIAAVLAVPLLLLTTTNSSQAGPPPDSRGYGSGDIVFRMFPHIHQHGPLYNYGPYYGYYPFKPYGPWDAYLRYDPFFYGDPYANFGNKATEPMKPEADHSGWYGRNPHLHNLALPGVAIPSLGLPHLFQKSGCTSCGFYHASWLHGGWFRGHTWLAGSPLTIGSTGPACTSCKGVATTLPTAPTGDPITRYSGFGNPAQSAVYYPATPVLNPAADVIPTGGYSR